MLTGEVTNTSVSAVTTEVTFVPVDHLNPYALVESLSPDSNESDIIDSPLASVPKDKRPVVTKAPASLFIEFPKIVKPPFEA